MDEKSIEKLMDKFENSNLNEFRLADNGSSIYFSKLNQPGAVAQNRPVAASAAKVPVSSKSQPKPKVAVKRPAVKKASKPAAGGQIKAPLVGLVYFAPNPKKPAFVKVGSHVNKGDVVCQIEAMKVLNNVKAPKSGVIEKRLVKNGSMVQYHQPIFTIKED